MKTFLALYMGSPDMANSRPSEEVMAKGIAAWKGWMADHAGSIVEGGGPLGVTKKISAAGVADTHNGVAAYVVVKAESHQDAAEMFLNHPHFTVFPGDSVEVMESLPIPS